MTNVTQNTKPSEPNFEPEAYSVQAFKDNEVGEYRTRFPTETKPLSDKQLFDVVMRTDDDMSDDDWKSLFLSSKPNTPPAIVADGEAMEKKAREWATREGAGLAPILDRLIKSKQDWEGGQFEVMFKLTSNMTAEQMADLPVPGSETGTNPDYYKVPVQVQGKKGTSTVMRQHRFYKIMSDNFPANIAKSERIEQLRLSLGDPAKVNQSAIPADIKDMIPDYRWAEISRLEGEIEASSKKVIEAFELMFQYQAVNALEGVTVELLYALGPKGELLDGEEGRARVIENTKTPIVVTTTLEKRKAIDTKRMGVGSFKKLDVPKATEGGGTYASLMKTIEREPKKPGTPGQAVALPQNIKTVDTFEARIVDVHSYLDEAWSDTKQAEFGAILQRLNSKNGNLLLLSLTDIRNIINDLLAKVHKSGERYAELNGQRAAAKQKDAA